MSAPLVLGFNASHNGSVCVLRGEELVVAVQEERLNRAKRARLFGARPCLSVPYALAAAGIEPAALASTAVTVQGYLDAPEQQLAANPNLAGYRGPPAVRVSHHHAHAVGAFVTSGFDEAAVLVVDGVGSPWVDLPESERAVCRSPDPSGWETVSLYRATRTAMVPLEKQLAADGRWLQRRPRRMPRFRSLGGMYSAVAVQIFGDALEAGKVMGLAPYGRATSPVDDFLAFDGDEIIFRDTVPDGFALGVRWPGRQRTYTNLAASVQQALEFALLVLVRRLRALSGCDRLCFAGGVALNSVANERLLREAGFTALYVPAAAEDSGVAIGAAYEGLHALTGRYAANPLRRDAVGCQYSSAVVTAAARAAPAIVEIASGKDVLDEAAKRLARGEFCGWFRGGSELGPRALGQRSILADPRLRDGKDRLNRRVKHREAFRPFAPAVLAEHATKWFDLGPSDESPFMLRVVSFRPEVRAQVPAVVHVDGTGRLQTVDRRDSADLHGLISRFHARTGVPMLLNTSFNIMGEPIVETPQDALWCFLATDLDFCVVEDHLFTKARGYCSPLDLVPVLAATRCQVELAIDGGALLMEPAAASQLSFAVETPWGETTVTAPNEVLAILQHVDGRRRGHDIVRALGGGEVAESRVLAAIGALRRARALAFQPFEVRRRARA